MSVTLAPLQQSDRKQFMKDNHFEEDDQIIYHETVEKSIDGGEAYRIIRERYPTI